MSAEIPVLHSAKAKRSASVVVITYCAGYRRAVSGRSEGAQNYTFSAKPVEDFLPVFLHDSRLLVEYD